MTVLTQMMIEMKGEMEAQREALRTIHWDQTGSRDATPGEGSSTRQQGVNIAGHEEEDIHPMGREDLGAPSATAAVDNSQLKIRNCPRMTDKMSMNVWAQIATEWVTTTPTKLRTGNGRRVINIELTNALEKRPEIQVAWVALHNKAHADSAATPPITLPTFPKLLQKLKETVESEEKRVAIESFNTRTKKTDETYSEYKLVLSQLAYVAYPDLDNDHRKIFILQRFLAGMGKAGETVRPQAPATIEEAISKALAADQERASKMEKGERVYLANDQGQKFKGKCNFCHRIGHKEIECRTKKRQGGQGGQGGTNRTYFTQNQTLKCYKCQGFNHMAKDCPTAGPPPGNQNPNPQGAVPKGPRAPQHCWVCGKPDHRAATCPDKK